MKTAFLFLIFLYSFSLRAQVMDPSLLMFSPASQTEEVKADPTPETPLENSYYVRKKKPKKRTPAAVATTRKPNSEDDEENDDSSSSTDSIKPIDSQKTQKAAANEPTEEPYEFPITQPGDQNFGQKVRNSLLGGDLELIDKYRGHLQNMDIRKNFFEISVAPQYFYNSSQSNYFYRNYVNSAPSLEVAATLWLTPFFGINVDYDTSLLDSISDSPTQNTLVNVTQQTLDFGLKWRRFFSSAPNSSSLSFGVNYTDHQFQVPLGDNVRMSTRNRGLLFLFDFSIPMSRRFFWNMGFNVAPSLTNEETPGASNFTSGSAGQSLGFGGYVGGEYRFNRRIQTFFKLSAETYRSQFSGISKGIDPVTSSTATNVNVNDAFYFFTLGIRLAK